METIHQSVLDSLPRKRALPLLSILAALLVGDGYVAGCGYRGGLVKFDRDGKAESVWFVPERDGCASFFCAQTHEMPDGHVYMAHWTGHGADDSKMGWQVVEFDREGNAVWHLHDPARFGSIAGIDVLP